MGSKRAATKEDERAPALSSVLFRAGRQKRGSYPAPAAIPWTQEGAFRSGDSGARLSSNAEVPPQPPAQLPGLLPTYTQTTGTPSALHPALRTLTRQDGLAGVRQLGLAGGGSSSEAARRSRDEHGRGTPRLLHCSRPPPYFRAERQSRAY